jgi:hypothetical protein
MAKKFGFEWTVTPEATFVSGYLRNMQRVRAEVRALAERRAPQIAQWMKENHLWKNQTGAAEAGLHTEVEQMSLDMIAIILAHGDDVPYAIYLEFAHAGVYSIISPALDYWGAVIWQDVRALV